MTAAFGGLGDLLGGNAAGSVRLFECFETGVCTTCPIQKHLKEGQSLTIHKLLPVLVHIKAMPKDKVDAKKDYNQVGKYLDSVLWFLTRLKT